MAVDNPQEMIGSQLCDNKSLHLTPLRSAGEFRDCPTRSKSDGKFVLCEVVGIAAPAMDNRGS